MTLTGEPDSGCFTGSETAFFSIWGEEGEAYSWVLAGAGAASAAGDSLTAVFLAAFTVFVLAAVFAADLTVLILVLGASTEAASAGFSSALAAVFLAGAAAFLAAVFRVAGFWAADASGALVSDGFLAIKFQVKGRIMN